MWKSYFYSTNNLKSKQSIENTVLLDVIKQRQNILKKPKRNNKQFLYPISIYYDAIFMRCNEILRLNVYNAIENIP